MILEGIAESVRKKYGDEAWQQVAKKAGIAKQSFGKSPIPLLLRVTVVAEM